MPHTLGSPLPPGDKHAVSVYIPTWKETEAWARRDPELVSKLQVGYPRFFVPLVVRELADCLLEWAASKAKSEFPNAQATHNLAIPDQLAILFAGEDLAISCQKYLESHKNGIITLLHITFEGGLEVLENATPRRRPCLHDDLFAVVYPQNLAVEGKAFWQHTGYGVSSRCATYWLENASFLSTSGSKNGHAKDLPVEGAKKSSLILRERIGDLLSTTENPTAMEGVYLYPTGMSAISHTATALHSLRKADGEVCRVAVFGFLYVDTFKVLSKVHNFHCELYGFATPAELDALEDDLTKGLQIDALYTEFPGNPLLGSVDLERLHTLAKKFDFLLIVDDTVATSVNVDLLSSCDIICTSLTKMFSGSCNVMGGSVVVNPKSGHFEPMQRILSEQFVDTYFPQDVLVMESNSADFAERVATASQNAEHIYQVLRQHESVAKVFYPLGNPTQQIYEHYRRPGRGYGYLLSIRFVEPEAAIAFHDALDVAKGPSLGTNFTLCCAYTLFAHYSELEWAAKYGVVEHLVRISVGVESRETLDKIVKTALSAASEKHQLKHRH